MEFVLLHRIPFICNLRITLMISPQYNQLWMKAIAKLSGPGPFLSLHPNNTFLAASSKGLSNKSPFSIEIGLESKPLSLAFKNRDPLRIANRQEPEQCHKTPPKLFNRISIYPSIRLVKKLQITITFPHPLKQNILSPTHLSAHNHLKVIRKAESSLQIFIRNTYL